MTGDKSMITGDKSPMRRNKSAMSRNKSAMSPLMFSHQASFDDGIYFNYHSKPGLEEKPLHD